MKISIIVPIYNVKPYLEQCILSIINQTYLNLEIILVNDGSTDGSLLICENFAKKDDRIVLITQQNMGLSSARNLEIEIATGEYIMFVDSDDWIHPKIVEDLLCDAMQHKVKLSMCKKKDCKKYIPFQMVEKECSVIPKNEAIPRMLKGEWISAWAKLYHKSLFNNIRFPVGKTNEDYAILIYLFEQCDYITFNSGIYYFYNIRPNSICTSKLNIHKFDEIENAKSVLSYIDRFYPKWHDLAEFNLITSLIKLINNCIEEDKEEIFADKLFEMRQYVKYNIFRFLSNRCLSYKYKMILISIICGVNFHRMFLSFLSKKYMIFCFFNIK